MKKLEQKQLLINQKGAPNYKKFRDFIGENAGWIELAATIARASLTGE
jgi:hypothetical protein